jgi:hypothetical protein
MTAEAAPTTDPKKRRIMIVTDGNVSCSKVRHLIHLSSFQLIQAIRLLIYSGSESIINEQCEQE